MSRNGRIAPKDCGQATGPRFGTVLVARNNKQRPTSMEMKLRTCCQRLRVVEKLGGAHFQLSSSPSLALRVYYQEDVKRFEEMLENARPKTAEDIQTQLNNWHGGCDEANDEDIDGLRAFRNHFKNTAVICVLPQGTHGYFDRPDSFVHRVQKLMSNWDSSSGKKSRVIFIHDVAPAVDALHSLVNALNPKSERSTQKMNRFRVQREELCVPDESGVIVPNENTAVRVADVLEEWARQQGIPEGEESVLMTSLGSLQKIVTASDADLQGVPVEQKTKAILHQFFGSKASDGPPSMLHTGRPSPHPITTLRSSQHFEHSGNMAQPAQGSTSQPFAHRGAFNTGQNQFTQSFSRGGGHGGGYKNGGNQHQKVPISHKDRASFNNGQQNQHTQQSTMTQIFQPAGAFPDVVQNQHLQPGRGRRAMGMTPAPSYSHPHQIMHGRQNPAYGDPFGDMNATPNEFDQMAPLQQHQLTFAQGTNLAQSQQGFDGSQEYYNGNNGRGILPGQGLHNPSQPRFGAFQQPAAQQGHLQQKLMHGPQQQMQPQSQYQYQHQQMLPQHQAQYQQMAFQTQPQYGQQQQMAHQAQYQQPPGLRRNTFIPRTSQGIRRIGDYLN